MSEHNDIPDGCPSTFRAASDAEPLKCVRDRGHDGGHVERESWASWTDDQSEEALKELFHWHTRELAVCATCYASVQFNARAQHAAWHAAARAAS